MTTSWERLRTSVVTLVLANLVPLVGVFAFGWTLHSILVVYWLESGVIGALTVPKLLRAVDHEDPETARGLAALADVADVDDDAVTFVSILAIAARAGFFCLHYGIFWVAHGAFVLWFPSFFPGLPTASPGVVAAGAVGLIVSHVVSYRRDYVGGREYEHTAVDELMTDPYRRVIVLHVTILLGAGGVASLDTPVAALGVMVVVKTALDLRGYWREHVHTDRRLPV